MTKRELVTLFVLWLVVSGVVAVIAERTQETPAAGDRRGNRCYNGRMWTDCGLAEKPEPPPHLTRSWILSEVKGSRDGQFGDMGRVDIIDTDGVCLYLAVRNAAQGGYAITAVPKTQLPKGAGCQ